jgi:hypothetical protein
MPTLLQLPEDIKGWVNLIVILLIVGGAALRPVLNWLIAKASPNAKDALEKTAGDPGKSKPPAPGRRGPTARPVARPMPVSGQASEVARPPRGMSPASRMEVEEVPTLTPAKPVIAPPSTRRPAKRQTQPRPAPLPSSRPPVPAAESRASTSAKSGKRASKRAQKKSPPRPVREVHHELKVHVHGRGTPQTTTEEGESTTACVDELDAVRHPTRRSLRQAILMSEILGPPLALRMPDERR